MRSRRRFSSSSCCCFPSPQPCRRPRWTPWYRGQGGEVRRGGADSWGWQGGEQQGHPSIYPPPARLSRGTSAATSARHAGGPRVGYIMSLYPVTGNFYSYQCNVTKYMYSSTALSNLRSFTGVAPFAGRQLTPPHFKGK